MIRKFRPFWSYDILQTEAWLWQMSLKGYHLKRINFATRTFFFEKGKCTSIRYRICYDKYYKGHIPNDLIDAGWEYISGNNRFYVMKTFSENPPLAPTYSNILERNSKIKYYTGIILFILICSNFPMIILLLVLIGNVAIEVDESIVVLPQFFDIILGIILPLTAMLTFVLLLYTYFKLREANKQLEKNCSPIHELGFTRQTDVLK